VDRLRVGDPPILCVEQCFLGIVRTALEHFHLLLRFFAGCVRCAQLFRKLLLRPLRSIPLFLQFLEFQLLRFLAERAGVVFSREELLTRVWGYRHVGRGRTVDTHILNLRGKLGRAGDLLEAVRGMGYKLRRTESDDETMVA
jgi:DNA-binding response OmpR family regulator